VYFAAAERALFAAILDQGHGYHVLCADDGAPVGGGGVRVRPDGRTAILRWGMIRAERHRQGLGRRLAMERLRLAVADPAIARLLLYTTGQAAGCYRRLGFGDTAFLPDHYGPGLDQHTMEATVDEALRP